MNLKLRKFDMTSIADDKVVIFIGKRETGKSFLVKDLLYTHQHMPVGTVISGTEGANQFYSKMVPPIFIHEEYSPEIIHNFLKRQKKIIKKMNNGVIEYRNVDPRAFMILDDCLYDNTWTKDKNIRALFMNGRHFKIMFLITMQYALGIPPNLRTNVDYVFILREPLYNNRKKLYEQYCGMFPNFEIFCQVMDQCTENYECLVVHNNAKSNKIEDQVFWYKANQHSDFKIGSRVLWDHHKQNYQDSSDEEDGDFHQKFSIFKKKNKPNIAVRKI